MILPTAHTTLWESLWESLIAPLPCTNHNSFTSELTPETYDILVHYSSPLKCPLPACMLNTHCLHILGLVVYKLLPSEGYVLTQHLDPIDEDLCVPCLVIPTDCSAV
jgi:hypothetical protein